MSGPIYRISNQMATDTEGSGHTTVAVGPPPFEALFIPAPE
ncbi:hypothetical protein [Nocardia sp. SYP-A9097]|nr:hypothetical protein [Nocardia sp. SYP-A9097]